MRFVNFQTESFRQDPRFARWAGQADRYPSWIWKLASIAAALVIIVPIVLLVGAAIVTFAVVFGLLYLVYNIRETLLSLFGGSHRPTSVTPGDEYRRNVRVLRDHE